MKGETYDWLGKPVYVPTTKYILMERNFLKGMVLIILLIAIILTYRPFMNLGKAMIENPELRKFFFFVILPILVLGGLMAFFSLKYRIEEVNEFGIYECGFCPPEKWPNLIRRTPRLCVRYSEIDSVKTRIIYKKLNLKSYLIRLKDGREIYFNMNRINNMGSGHMDVLKTSTILLDYALENREKGCIKKEEFEKIIKNDVGLKKKAEMCHSAGTPKKSVP